MNTKILIPFFVLFGVVACDTPSPDTGRTIETLSGLPVQRFHDPQQVALGETVYRQHCAQCHGQNAEGDPDWRRHDAEGMYPPPPLNGTGHAWHHSKQWLKDMVLYGSEPGKGKMPGWRITLSDDEVDAVIAWFQAQWPDPVYAAWYENQQRSRGVP